MALNKQQVEALTREAVLALPQGSWVDLRWVARKDDTSDVGFHTWRIGLLYKGDRPITVEVFGLGKSSDDLQREIAEKIEKAVSEKRG